jgi:hypothetical protein
MHKSSSTHVPFAELSTEARTLFFLNALAALARYGAQRPKQSDIAEQLEVIWNRNRFVVSDLSNPHRMTDILKAHFAAHLPLPVAMRPVKVVEHHRMRIRHNESDEQDNLPDRAPETCGARC